MSLLGDEDSSLNVQPETPLGQDQASTSLLLLIPTNAGRLSLDGASLSDPLRCTFCPALCIDNKDLRQHQNEQHLNKLYPETPAGQDQVSTLPLPMPTDADGSPSDGASLNHPLRCTICLLLCRNPKHLRRHQNEHLVRNSYNCPFCGLGLINRYKHTLSRVGYRGVYPNTPSGFFGVKRSWVFGGFSRWLK